jgi:hypothetical protein
LGGITWAPWDEDAPYDPFNECRIERCSDGEPVTVFPGPDTSCLTGAGAGTCDGLGNCFVPQPLGSWCTSDLGCESGHCVENFCCESSCDGPCLGCLAAYNGVSDGSCLPVIAGTDPGWDCPGAEFCDGNGQCVQCLDSSSCATGQECSSGTCVGAPACSSAADCGVPQDCYESFCVDGVCNQVPSLYGTAAATQVVGDCRWNICDGSGALTWEPDDADIPEIGSQCTLSSCSGGNPIVEPVPDGATCDENGGSVCENGTCVP